MRRRALAVPPVRPTDEQHRVTTFELFFDLVFVFAVTQVTAFMAHEHSAEGVLRGLVLIALIWFMWSAYAWLGNQARADEGPVRAAMSVAMAAIFVFALAVPEAFEDADGGVNGPLVLVGAYVVVRGVHLLTYALAAGEDRGLRHQIAVTCVPLLAGSSLLVAGALAGGSTQTALFAAGFGLDAVGVYVTSREGDWRLHSAAHWSERHGLFMILAIGESIVAIGAGASELPVSAALIAAATLGIGISLALWWLYFDVVSLAAEHVFAAQRGRVRVRTAVEAYTYLHLPIVAGVVLTALGVEEVLAHAEDEKGLGTFAASALLGGLALYLAGHVGFKRRIHGALSGPRLVAIAALLAGIPLAASLRPLLALAAVAAGLALLVAVETIHYASKRHELRHHEAAPQA